MLVLVDDMKAERKKVLGKTSPALVSESSRVVSGRGIVTPTRLVNKFDSAAGVGLPINGNSNNLVLVGRV